MNHVVDNGEYFEVKVNEGDKNDQDTSSENSTNLKPRIVHKEPVEGDNIGMMLR